MPEQHGFEVHVPSLHDLSAQLTDLAGRTRTLKEKLAEISADTGRADSDEAGRLGPADAADLIDRLRDALDHDGGQVRHSAASYSEVDNGNVGLFGGTA